MLDNQIAIINYNMGNLKSVAKAFEKFNSKIVITNNKDEIKQSSKIVLPGVGSFREGMNYLNKLGLVDILNQEIINNNKPFLGICLGMQLIANNSCENGKTNGLGWLNAEVVKFDFSKKNNNFKIPHIGWNVVNYKNNNILFKSIPDKSDFYFVHSYFLKIYENSVITSTTDYGVKFTSSVNKNNIFAFQFHPEKSQTVGLKIIENFIKL